MEEDITPYNEVSIQQDFKKSMTISVTIMNLDV
jgi:hypothetical protein